VFPIGGRLQYNLMPHFVLSFLFEFAFESKLSTHPNKNAPFGALNYTGGERGIIYTQFN